MTTIEYRAEVVAQICDLLLDGRVREARGVAIGMLPFSPIPNKRRTSQRKTGTPPSEKSGAARDVKDPKKLQIWRRDGFRCRYTKQRLVFPQTLELLSLLLPEELPYHNPPHGKYALTHIIMWELWPAIDHVKAISRSYDSILANSVENLVTAAAPVNSEKSSNDIEFFRWPLLSPEPLPDWDGLTAWYVQYLNQDNSWLSHASSGSRLQRWFKQLTKVDPTKP